MCVYIYLYRGQVDAKRNAMNAATPEKGPSSVVAKPKPKPKVRSYLDTSIKQENLEAKRTIGTGTFGRVKLVQDKSVLIATVVIVMI